MVFERPFLILSKINRPIGEQGMKPRVRQNKITANLNRYKYQIYNSRIKLIALYVRPDPLEN